MSRTAITRDMVDPDNPKSGQLVGATMLTGDDKITLNEPDNTADMPMIVKSLRLPVGIYDAALDVGHPDGFSGVVREALNEWLERHSGAKNEIVDVIAAVAVIQRAAGLLDAAMKDAA